MRSIFVFISILSMVPMALIKPHIGVLLWSWISYMNPHRLTFGLAYDFQFLDVIAIATAVALLFSAEKKTVPSHPIMWLIVIYYLWTCLTTFLAVNPEDAMEKWIKFSKIILFTLLSMILLCSKNRLHAFIWIVCISIGFYGYKGGVFTLLTGGVSIVWGPQGSFFADNNHMALTLITTLPIVRYLSLAAPNKYLRVLALITMPIFLAAILGSHSRGAFLAGGAMIAFMVVRSNRKFVASVLAVMAVAGALIFMPDEWRERMDTIEQFSEDGSARGRMDMWAFTFRVTDDNPIVGGGFLVHYSADYRARYLPADVSGRAVHSIYFEVLGEHGYVGFFLYLLLAATAFFGAGTLTRLGRRSPEVSWAAELGPMIQTSLVGFAVGGAFLNLATFDLFYHVVAMVAIALTVVKKSLPEDAGAKKTLQIPGFDVKSAQGAAAERAIVR